MTLAGRPTEVRPAVGPIDDPRRYHLIDDVVVPVAEGGQGFVFRAVRASDGLAVALKQLTSMPIGEWPGHARRIDLVRHVEHPALGRHLDAFLGPNFFTGAAPHPNEFDIPYTAMAWVDGEDLTTAVVGADPSQWCAWVRDVGHAVAALHDHRSHDAIGIVHRDIKPSNVRITGDGAVLIDFGIARSAIGDAMTRPLGSPGWMPPEALDDRQPVGPRSDGWQVAGLASWAVLGAPPGSRDGLAHRDDLERALRGCGAARPAALARHITSGLATDPDRRPPDLRRWSDQLVALTSPSRRHPLPRRAVAAAVVAAILVSTLVGVVSVRRGTDSSVGAAVAAREPVVVAPSTDAGPDPAVAGPEDCVAYDPTSLELQARGEQGTALADGNGTQLAVLDDDRDASNARAVAAQYDQLCTIGARNSQPNPAAFIVRYWKGGPDSATPPPDVDCLGYEPAALDVAPRPDGGWQLRDRAVGVLADLDSRQDAEQALAVARQHTMQCFIGRQNARGRPDYILDYWR